MHTVPVRKWDQFLIQTGRKANKPEFMWVGVSTLSCSSCLEDSSWANTGGRSSVVGFQAVHPSLGLISAGIGPHWQEVSPVCEHLTAGCLNCSVYDSSPATLPRRQVPINGGQSEHLSQVWQDYKLAEFQNFGIPPNQLQSALLATVLCWKNTSRK